MCVGGLLCDFAKTSVILPQITGALLNTEISFFYLTHVVSSLSFMNEVIRVLPKSPKSFPLPLAFYISSKGQCIGLDFVKFTRHVTFQASLVASIFFSR